VNDFIDYESNNPNAPGLLACQVKQVLGLCNPVLISN